MMGEGLVVRYDSLISTAQGWAFARVQFGSHRIGDDIIRIKDIYERAK